MIALPFRFFREKTLSSLLFQSTLKRDVPYYIFRPT